MTSVRARQSRLVVLVNIAISVGIVTAIAGVSVFRRPASPPSIAEFAPANPARQIDEPDPEPAQHGASNGPTGPMARPTAATGVPSALQCWSWPDGSTTQTFDRQSPPCIASWNAAAGNGGATARGVTRTEVRVGVPAASVSQWQPIADFFSNHYQFYGRRIRLVPLGLVDLTTAEGQRAAAAVAAEKQVFAAVDRPERTSGELPDLDVYLDSLASRSILGVVTSSTQVSTTAMSAAAPYAWSVYPAMDTTQRTLASLVCRELSGHRAKYSKQTAGQTRRFLALVPAARVNGGRAFDVSSLETGFDRCHVDVAIREYDPAVARNLDQLMVDARRDQATTLLAFGGATTVARALMPSAARVGFQPEWVIAGALQQQQPDAWRAAPKGQLRSLFGLAAWDRPVPQNRNVAAMALREVAPRATFTPEAAAIYDGLSLIAAGLQLAGPRPSAQLFADGLESATFANPGAGADPDFQAVVGFGDVDHSMVDDFAQIWWRDGSFCLVGSGRRWTADTLPYADPGFFNAGRGC